MKYQIKRKIGFVLVIAMLIVMIYPGETGTAAEESDGFFLEGETVSGYVGAENAITIPEGITKIGENAFLNTTITSVSIPEGVTEIGDYAFSGCTLLTSVTIPASVQSVGKYAFYGCTSLDNVVWESSAAIPDSAFVDCVGLTNLTISNDIPSIGNEAFKNCESLLSFAVPTATQSISATAFDECTSMAAINVSEENAYLATYDNVLYSSTGVALKRCPQGAREITIHDGTKVIESNAFYGCKLGKVVIPESVETIEDGAFEGSEIQTLVLGASIKKFGAQDTSFNIHSIEVPGISPVAAQLVEEYGEIVVTDYVPTPPDTEEPNPPDTEDPIPGTDTEEQSTQQPSTEEPSTQQPSTEQPSTQQPSTEEPSTQQPSTEEPSTQQPSTEEPSTEQQSTQQPNTEQPSTQQASTQQQNNNTGNTNNTGNDSSNTSTGNSSNQNKDTGNTTTGNKNNTGSNTITGNKNTGTNKSNNNSSTNNTKKTSTGNSSNQNKDTGDTGTTVSENTQDNNQVETNAVTTDGASATADAQQGTAYIAGSPDIAGWDLIYENMQAANDGDTIFICMNGTTVVPERILTLAKDKNLTLALDMGNGIGWTIKGGNLTGDGLTDIDFGVTMGTNNVPAALQADVADSSWSTQMHLAYDGIFGWTALLTINVGAEHAGMNATLFYYNAEEQKLEYTGQSFVGQSGDVTFAFNHASDYVVVLDGIPSSGSPMTVSNTANTGNTAEATTDGEEKQDETQATQKDEPQKGSTQIKDDTPKTGQGLNAKYILCLGVMLMGIYMILTSKKPEYQAKS